jgi:methionyl-tRNA synthetase
VGSQLPADLYARYRRARGDEVLFLCATDEHGTPAELAAKKAGLPVAEYCARMHETQEALAEGFRLSFDRYGRSSSPQNHRLTQHFAGRLAEAGLIEEVSERQVYSRADGRFLPDRYIEGTCPNCGYERARGDQCENCTKQLDPTDLINPRSAISGSTDLEVRETTHLYLRQSALASEIEAWIDGQTGWPLLTTSIAKKWLHDGEGLRDRSITRDLDWGVPVPDLPGKVFYVWFDAPIAYIAATEEGVGEAYRSWWREDEGADDVRYVQFMGKDNVAFHTVSFPCTQLGSREPWKKVDTLKSLNWLTWYGGKFSTSEGRGIFMDQALDLLPADLWRWYLMANAPESDDTAFTLENFQQTVNKDLADVLGNFVNRITRFAGSKFDGQVPSGGTPGAAEEELKRSLKARIATYTGHLEAMEFRKAFAELRGIWVLGNEYLQGAAPWAVFKEDQDKAAMIVRTALNLVPLYASLSAPVIPFTAEKLASVFGTDTASWPTGDELDALTPGAAIEAPGVLFKKIEDEDVENWAQRFGAPRGEEG